MSFKRNLTSSEFLKHIGKVRLGWERRRTIPEAITLTDGSVSADKDSVLETH